MKAADMVWGARANGSLTVMRRRFPSAGTPGICSHLQAPRDPTAVEVCCSRPVLPSPPLALHLFELILLINFL